ncbi:MAG: ribosomal RNA small subunit methyltransferase A [Nitrososphaeria archaeon]|nr:ribosomal RNA small subunit methyltransferase A [Nitrososphaeria archaeon]NDB51766.1 ribosomal RNA small subunit methyltransferase A [Nitrosopumilaceae archaeon]NDB88930.1 ribosomal RNA small subunit methyltransferase A [Nitrososphaerota archaeon]NDB46774.1 ribosomal RNA small subunit methyltransferase A [Nitrososphaeria archaeon]NDB90693.1 ribosomal RNA small subunit methyltransferase A [Nitrososphaerota archaeon]
MSKNRRQRLGQHFLKSFAIATKIVESTQITPKDTVLEIGTGPGILTPLLCKQAKSVVTIEADESLYSDAILKFSKISNLEIMYGDGFDSDVDFTIFVSNLPYSESKRAIEWLAQRKFKRAVVMVQKEFADKLVAKGRDIHAITILANHCFDVETIVKVGKNNFSPPPKVDSVVLRLTPKKQITQDLIDSVEKLFSQRRKTISNIAKSFGKSIQSDKRLEQLTPEEIIKIAKQL